ncbi:helix-turn-helix transcriptional regulator [Hephaestia mangrovi]|uniref:helix-turn-helix transcriptional regulator n=1 Tax=Hephaestia mangrovi TaxID=2873268 RepID=UPI001CA669B2|nr:helix-turn-helix transcriptional regulator [Hephaestia mangrovi]MBY8827090.1 helix-turn-helix transcriptional regulator [Hephaestia mangrovi]
MKPDEKRRLLGQFIRSHRERATPDVPTPRRRTPGLRREELAQRAGIGVTWCAWIEQGREVRPSPEALARLAIALALTPAERAYLFELAERRDPDEPEAAPADEAPASLRAMIDTLDTPAYGLDRCWTIRCWNDAAARLFGGWPGAGDPKNLLRYTFTAPAAMALIPDWDNRARRLLAEFRADFGRALDDPAANALVEEMKQASPLFAAEWQTQTVTAREGGVRTFAHPVLGAISYRQHSFAPAERPDYKLVVLLPDRA